MLHPDAYVTLIEPTELSGLLGSPWAAIIDCRHDLARPEWGAAAFAQRHIPGARFAHLDRDLSSPITPASGRHPLPDPDTLAGFLGRCGIDRHVQVVAYDQGNGATAARLWWLLRLLGHGAVAVLDGGLATWEAAGLPLEDTVTAPAPRRFTRAPALGTAVTTAELVAGLASGTLTLVDARSAERFAGRNETLDTVAGHLPGARNHPFLSNLDAAGRFLSCEELRRRWDATLGGVDPQSVVAMCGSGVTACHDLLAMQVAGLPGARLYADSWSGWIRDPARPVATS